MTSGSLARITVLGVGVSLAVSGCVYYNALYNAGRLYDEAERSRADGQDSLADARYREVVTKAAAGYRKEPDGAWADDALLLMGRAHLRLGDLRAARAALAEAVERADDDQVRRLAQLYLGVSLFEGADRRGAIPLLNAALGGLPEGELRAEGHLWRGRVLLASGQADMGWWDLDRAGAEGPAVRVDAALERVRWGLATDERRRVREGFDRLQSYPEAARRADTVLALSRSTARQWGPAMAVDFLAGADTSRWERSARGRVRLTRAALRRDAGDTVTAHLDVEAVADGAGEGAAQARLMLARWLLAGAREIDEAHGAVPILLPGGNDPAVRSALDDVQQMEALAELGATEPLALFAAGELARDRLEAPALAARLFLEYAAARPDEPWAPKALLAAIELTDDDGERDGLRVRLERRADSPYVLAARGEPAPGLEALEEELGRRLQEIQTS